MAPIRAMLGHAPTSAAIDVAFFILMVGGFLGVVNATGTLDVGIASILKNTGPRKNVDSHPHAPLRTWRNYLWYG